MDGSASLRRIVVVQTIRRSKVPEFALHKFKHLFVRNIAGGGKPANDWERTIRGKRVCSASRENCRTCREYRELDGQEDVRAKSHA